MDRKAEPLVYGPSFVYALFHGLTLPYTGTLPDTFSRGRGRALRDGEGMMCRYFPTPLRPCR